MQAEPLRIVTRVARILEELQVPFLIGGSLASSVHGVPRATLDADMVAALRLLHIARLVSALGDEFYADRESIEEAIRQRRTFNLIHLPTMYKVDVFIARPDAMSREEMARRQVLTVHAEGEEFVLPFCSAEDTIVQKLEWYLAGGEVSDRQWQDLLGVLRIQRTVLDYDYIRRWAMELGTSDLMERAIEEAGRDE
jgi:hypothetical protein